MAPKSKRLVSRSKKGEYRKINYGRIKTISGKTYDRTILRAAEIATKGKGDGRISAADTKMICRAVRPTADGRSSYSDVEKATMRYVRTHFKFTPTGDTAMRAFIAKMAARQAVKTKGLSLKRPAGALRKPAPTKNFCSTPKVPKVLQSLRAHIVNLERRPDRWARVAAMLEKGAPWLQFEKFPASDGTKNPIPEEDVATQWNTHRNAHFADYYEWVYDAPGSEKHGTFWMWAADTLEEDEKAGYRFKEDTEEEWSYIAHAPTFKGSPVRTGTVEITATKETFKVKMQFQSRCLEPGEVQFMSGGERGCAHSHLRLWRLAATRHEPTLALEDDVYLSFDRSAGKGKMNGKTFTKRLASALEHAPSDFDVIYLGWSGWRGGNFMAWKPETEALSKESQKYLRKAEYVWTTVAYVISPKGAQKLLDVGVPLNQPVDNFMAWEASQGRLNSFVCLDAGDEDGTWSGGIVDQFDFQGDSDIKKSDGGHQGDDAKEFSVSNVAGAAAV